jgi:hypothetical protein
VAPCVGRQRIDLSVDTDSRQVSHSREVENRLAYTRLTSFILVLSRQCIHSQAGQGIQRSGHQLEKHESDNNGPLFLSGETKHGVVETE